VSRDEAYMAHEETRDEEFPPVLTPFDNGGRYALPPFDPWRAPGQGNAPQQVQPQRRDAYGQPQPPQPPQRFGNDPRSGPQPRGNSGFFWDWH
jgi:hypothetical protein